MVMAMKVVAQVLPNPWLQRRVGIHFQLRVQSGTTRLPITVLALVPSRVAAAAAMATSLTLASTASGGVLQWMVVPTRGTGRWAGTFQV